MLGSEPRRTSLGPRPLLSGVCVCVCVCVLWRGAEVRGSLKPGWGGNSRGARAPGEDFAPTLNSQSAPL